MSPDLILPVISRWVHVGTAITLAGGLIFMCFVLAPSLADAPVEIGNKVRARWKKFTHIGIALFLISGFYNYIAVSIPGHKGNGLYHGLIGTKIILAFGVFFIASVLVGRSAGTQKFRDNAGKWQKIAVLLVVIIVGISGFAKVALPGTTPPADNSSEAADAE